MTLAVTTAAAGLKQGAAEGDFSQQLVAVIPHLRAFARSLCGRADLADDLAQEAMAKAWAARDSYLPDSNFKAWVFMILRNHYFSHRRKMSRVADWDPEVADNLMVTGESQSGSVEIAELSRALQTLPAEQREALILVGAGGFSYDEVAKIAGCAEGTIKSRVARARQALAKAIEQRVPNQTTITSGAEATHDILSELERLAR